MPLSLFFTFSVFSYLLRRNLAKDFTRYNRLIHAIFFVLFLLPTGLIASRFFPNNLDVGWENLLWLGLGSLVWPVANIVAFRANHKLDAGTFSILNNLAPISTLLIALTILGETPSSKQILGAILLILSGIVIAVPLVQYRLIIGSREILIGVLSAVIIGVGYSYERFMLTRIDFGAYLVLGWGSQVLWAAILAAKEYKYLPKLWSNVKLRSPILAYGLTNALRGMCFVTALSLASASVVGPAANFLSVIIVIAGYFILGEKDHLLNKLLAVAIGISGLLLISN